jgi:tRNA-Thr(GGU) m(6)t(6)A37 methyltransferase TsaA
MKKPLGHKAPQDHTVQIETAASFTMRAIAIARSPYKERFGAPRQANVTSETRDATLADGSIELLPDIPSETLRSLEGFDRVWALYVFHLNLDGEAPARWPTLVRPPRDPERQHGLFATRAPHRPSPIGLSALAITRIEGRTIHVRGIDLLDGTPVIDLKPYVPYCDAFPDARAGWVDDAEARGRR